MPRWLLVATGLLGCLLLTGCDGPSHYSELRVNLIFRDDGTGQMSWRVPGQVDPAQMNRYGIEFAHALGLPLPTLNGSGGAGWTGLSTHRIEVDISGLVNRLKSYDEFAGYGNMFVSVCVPQLQGQAGGIGVQFTHYHSCATFAEEFREVTAPANATITFSRQWPVGMGHLIVICLATIVGLGAWEIRRRVRHDGRRLVLALLASAAPVVCFGLGFNAFVARQEADPWWSTELDFDNTVAETLKIAGLLGLLAGLLLPVAYSLRRRRNVEPSSRRR